MTRSFILKPRICRLAVALAVLALLALTFSPARADMLDDFTGYTRPGQTPAPRPAGPMGVAEAAGPMDINKDRDPFGVTTYFAVFDRGAGTDGDIWGTGLQNIEKSFVPGRLDNEDTRSRGLDTRARYLYVYQVINDSGFKSQLKTATIRLLVDPQMITSWGHFSFKEMNSLRGVGFAVGYPEGKGPRQGGILPISSEYPAVSDAEYRDPAPHFLAPRQYTLREILLENQVNPAAAGGIALDRGQAPEMVKLLHDVRYENGLPPARRVSRYLRMGAASFGPAIDPITGLPIAAPVTVAAPVSLTNPYLPRGAYDPYATFWTSPTLAALIRPASTALVEPPVTVVTQTPSGTREVEIATTFEPAVRAYWLDRPLRPGERSTLFGFTSDLPPTYDNLRARGNTVPAVAPAAENVPDVRPANLMVDGEIPTPVAFETAAPGAAPAGVGGTAGVGTLGGVGGLGGGGTTGGGGVGALGTAGAPTSGGGGLGATGGGGDGNGNGTRPTEGETDQATAQNQEGSAQNQEGSTQAQDTAQDQGTGDVVVTTGDVNVSQEQSQQQQQQQQQKQEQEQSQTQDVCCEDDMKPIPEPAAIIAGLLGVPALILVARRRRKAGTSQG